MSTLGANTLCRALTRTCHARWRGPAVPLVSGVSPRVCTPSRLSRTTSAISNNQTPESDTQSTFDELKAPSQQSINPAEEIPESPPARVRQQIVLNEYDLEEHFVKGSGPGGQKINKCRHRVQLKHLPTGVMVESQRFRELVANRKEARKLLKLKLDQMINGELSKRAVQISKEQRRKKKAAQRTKKKSTGGMQEEVDEKATDIDAEEDVEPDSMNKATTESKAL